MVWTDETMMKGHGVSGNDRAAYANAAAQIQAQIDQGHRVDENARKILRDAEYIGVYHPKS